jgi:hypothetical protein
MEADIASPCHQARLTLATLGQDRIDQPRVKARDGELCEPQDFGDVVWLVYEVVRLSALSAVPPRRELAAAPAGAYSPEQFCATGRSSARHRAIGKTSDR